MHVPHRAAADYCAAAFAAAADHIVMRGAAADRHIAHRAAAADAAGTQTRSAFQFASDLHGAEDSAGRKNARALGAAAFDAPGNRHAAQAVKRSERAGVFPAAAENAFRGIGANEGDADVVSVNAPGVVARHRHGAVAPQRSEDVDLIDRAALRDRRDAGDVARGIDDVEVALHVLIHDEPREPSADDAIEIGRRRSDLRGGAELPDRLDGENSDSNLRRANARGDFAEVAVDDDVAQRVAARLDRADRRESIAGRKAARGIRIGCHRERDAGHAALQNTADDLCRHGTQVDELKLLRAGIAKRARRAGWPDEFEDGSECGRRADGQIEDVF